MLNINQKQETYLTSVLHVFSELFNTVDAKSQKISNCKYREKGINRIVKAVLIIDKFVHILVYLFDCQYYKFYEFLYILSSELILSCIVSIFQYYGPNYGPPRRYGGGNYNRYNRYGRRYGYYGGNKGWNNGWRRGSWGRRKYNY